MKFDSIDLQGDILLNGERGTINKALGYSNGVISWISVSGGIDGIRVTASSYVICETVNTGNPTTDATTNGQRLRSAYASASNIYSSNRVAVIVMPGDYNLGSTPLSLTQTNIDLVGFSQNASSVRLRATGNHVLSYQNNVNSGLFNITLGTASVTSVTGSDTSYLRWKNVVTNGNCFYTGTNTQWGFSTLNGEFEDIVINSGSNFAAARNNVYGIYNGIRSDSATFSFRSNDYIIGTFSNISIQNSSNIFFSGTVSAYLENISIRNIIGNFLLSTGNLDAYCKNIDIGNITLQSFYSLGQLNGFFKDIIIRNAGANCFVGINGMDGIYDNIRISSSGGSLFYSGESILGTYSNITLTDFDNCFFGNSILGTFENFNIINPYHFFSADNYLTGTFKNLKIDLYESQYIGKLPTSFQAGNISANFSDIFLYASRDSLGKQSLFTQSFFVSETGITGKFENIYIDVDTTQVLVTASQSIDVEVNNFTIKKDLVNFMKNTIRPQLPGELGWSLYGGSILGTYSNITLNNVFRDCFRATDNINISLDGLRLKSVNLHVEQTIGSLMKSNNGSIYGTYKNIKVDSLITEDDNALHFFYASGDINGTFENIYCERNAHIDSFRCELSMYGTFKNINFPYGTRNEGEFNNRFFLIGGVIDGLFENIFINSEASKFFEGSQIMGTYSHIKNNSANVSNVFKCSGDISGYFYDIEFGNISDIFIGDFTTPITFDRLRIFTDYYTTSPFKGLMRNCIIDGQRNGNAIYLGEGGAVIERCKFLTGADPAITTNGAIITAKISYTIIDGQISPDITNDLDFDWNIVNSNID
jgi:hypothetical protein